MPDKYNAPAYLYVRFHVTEMLDGKDPRVNLYWRAEKALRSELVMQSMVLCHFNQTEAANMLGINRNTLRSWIEESKINFNEEVADGR